MKTRLIGLGNPLLKDDGVGIYCARAVAAELARRGLPELADVVETEVAGFALLDLMTGWERIILADALQFDGVRPGTVLRIEPGDLRTSLRIRSVHEIDLPTVLELGRRLGLSMPEQVVIFGIQAADAFSFGELLTPETHLGMEQAVAEIFNELLSPCPATAGC